MARKTIETVWAADNPSAIEEPSTSKQQEGYSAEKPPYQYHNWKFNQYSSMLQDAEKNGVMSWLTDTSYNQGGLCLGSDGIVYQSQIDSNQGNDPTTDGGTNWQVFDQSGGVGKLADYDAAATYAQYDIVSGADGFAYVSQQDSNTGNALSNTTYWRAIKASKGRLVKLLTNSGTLTGSSSANDTISSYLTSSTIKPGDYLVKVFGAGGGGGGREGAGSDAGATSFDTIVANGGAGGAAEPLGNDGIALTGGSGGQVSILGGGAAGGMGGGGASNGNPGGLSVGIITITDAQAITVTIAAGGLGETAGGTYGADGAPGYVEIYEWEI